MSIDRSCANCGAVLEPDAAEGSVCATCAGAGSAATADDVTPTVAADGATPAPSSSPSIRVPAQPLHERIGDFEVLDKLGQGGMGAVYRARQVSLDRLVALKILPNQFEDDETFVSRFRREATVAASLNHPNLVRVYSSGQADGVHYIAMELVEGENLRQFLRRAGPMAPLDALRTAVQVVRGLQHGWQKAQLIHRDIKPSNIYLSQSGDVKVGDLGLAKSLSVNTTGITHTGTALGTPHYVSPEQARGDKVIDCRADIYSLGCTLYEMLTGSTPYRGSDPVSIMHAHLHSPPPAILKVLPQCPVPIARLVSKMLQKKPHERHQGYDELVAAMEAAIDQLENPNTGPSAVVQAWKEIGKAERSFLPVRGSAGSAAAPAERPASQPGISTRLTKAAPGSGNRKGVWIGVAAAAVVLAGLAVVFLLPNSPAPRPSPVSKPVAVQTSTPAQTGVSPTPIRPWNSAESLARFSSAAWQPDGSFILNGGVFNKELSFRDVLVRASIRMNRDAKSPQINLRQTGPAAHDTYYLFRVVRQGDAARLELVRRSENGDSASIQQWPLPRLYGDNEWVRLEVRAVRDELSATVDGQPLGTARDATIPGSGSVSLYALRNGYFRDVEIVPLDGLAEVEALKLAGLGTTAGSSAPPPSAAPAPADFRPLFDGRTFAGWTKLDGQEVLPDWKVSDGVIMPLQHGCIRTNEQFGDFELDLEFRASESGNGGVFYHVPSGVKGESPVEYPEMQLAGPKADGNWPSGTLYGVVKNSESVTIAPGEWNRARLVVRGGKAEHWINDRLVCSYDFADQSWPTLAQSARLSAAQRFSALPRRGSIVLQAAQAEIAYRNVRIRPLDSRPSAEALKLAGASASPSATGSEWRDLLAEVDLTRAAMRGTWKKVAAGVELDKPDGPGVLEFDYAAPSDYEFEIEFTPTSSGNNVNQHLSMGGHSFIWKMNAHARKPPVYGLDIVDGKNCSEPGGVGTVHDDALEPGQRYKSRVIVHPGRVQAFFNEVEYLAWTGDAQRLSTNPLDVPPRDPQHLALGSWARGVIFHRAAVRKLPAVGPSAAAPPANESAHGSAPATAADPWQDLLHASENLKLTGVAERRPDGSIRFDATGDVSTGWAPKRDVAVRMRANFSNRTLIMRLRQNEKGCYQVYVRPGGGSIMLERFEGPPSKVTPLKEFTLREPLQNGRMYELEVRIAGQTFTVKFNGEALGTAKDDAFPVGHFSVGANDRDGDDVILTLFGLLDLDERASSSAPPAGSSTPAAATKDAPFVNSLGMKFVPVRITGGPTDRQRLLFSIWETRVQDYDAFVKETQHDWPRDGFIGQPTHPAGNTSWEDAQAFCRWLTERERKAGRITANERYRLPTSHEWSCAVGIGDREDGSAFPYQNEKKVPDVFPWGLQWPPPPGAGNYKGEENDGTVALQNQAPIAGYRDGFRASAPVGSFAPNSLGLYDLGGNVWEKCEDLFDPGHPERVVRGQSYSDADRDKLLASNVSRTDPASRYPNQGFRVVLAPDRN